MQSNVMKTEQQLISSGWMLGPTWLITSKKVKGIINSTVKRKKRKYGDVTFDTTYRTNKYDMPFAPFTGVNPTGSQYSLDVHFYKMRHKLPFYGCLRHGLKQWEDIIRLQLLLTKT